MKKLFNIIFILLFACGPQMQEAHQIKKEPRPDASYSFSYPVQLTRAVYIDPAFTENEKFEIERAIQAVIDTTQHIVEFKILEYNTGLTTDLILNNGFIITKAKSTDLLVKDIESGLKNKKDKLMGHYYTKSLIPLVLIVADRLKINEYKKITMHELLHSANLLHVSDSSALMYEYVDGTNPGCFSTADLEELCGIYDCNYRVLRSCND